MKTAASFSVAMVLIMISGCIHSGPVKFSQYTRVMSLANKMFTRWLLWKYQEVETATECARHCQRDQRCVTFQHNMERGICWGHAVTLTDLDDATDVPRQGHSLYYSSKASHFIGAKCSSISECRIANSTCHDGVCKCQLGFNFSPAESACTHGCKEYGEEFTVYKKHVIIGHDFFNLNTTDVADCERGCVATKTYTCVSIDHNYFANYCRYSTASWNDYPKSNMKNNDKHNFLQRDCKP